MGSYLLKQGSPARDAWLPTNGVIANTIRDSLREQGEYSAADQAWLQINGCDTRRALDRVIIELHARHHLIPVKVDVFKYETEGGEVKQIERHVDASEYLSDLRRMGINIRPAVVQLAMGRETDIQLFRLILVPVCQEKK